MTLIAPGLTLINNLMHIKKYYDRISGIAPATRGQVRQAWQKLVSTGAVWNLSPAHQKMARQLIDRKIILER